MLLITANDEGGKPRILTVTRAREGKLSATLRLCENSGADSGVPTGTLLGSIRLSAADMAELKAAL